MAKTIKNARYHDFHDDHGVKVKGNPMQIMQFCDWLRSLPVGHHRYKQPEVLRWWKLLPRWTRLCNECFLHPIGMHAQVRRHQFPAPSYVAWSVGVWSERFKVLGIRKQQVSARRKEVLAQRAAGTEPVSYIGRKRYRGGRKPTGSHGGE